MPRFPDSGFFHLRAISRWMPKATDTDQAALARAAELLGGVEPLSHRLRVPLADLERWIAGEEIPPIGIFAQAIDIVLENSGPQNFARKK